MQYTQPAAQEQVCRPPAVTYSFHGGAGLLMSVGLLAEVPLEPMEACIQSQWSSGSFQHCCAWLLNVSKHTGCEG